MHLQLAGGRAGRRRGERHAGWGRGRDHGLSADDAAEAEDLGGAGDLATIGERVAFPGADPDRLAACEQLRALQVVLCLAHLRDAFVDLPGWDDAIRGMLPAVT